MKKALVFGLILFASAWAHAATTTIGELGADTAPGATDVVEIEQSDGSASNKATLGDIFTKAHGLGNWKWFYTNGSGVITAVANGADGTIPIFKGASAAPEVSAFTLAAPGAAGGILYSDGTNWTRVTTLSGLTFDLGTTTANTVVKTDADGVMGPSYFVLAGPTAERVYTFPDAATTMVGTATTQTLTNKSITAVEVDGHTNGTNLTAANVSGTTIYNVGQGTNDVVLNLPAAAAGYNALFMVGEAQAGNDWKVRAGASDLIVSIAADGTPTAGSDNGYYGFAAPAVGNSFACWTYKSGASTYDWAYKVISGTITTTAP